MKNSKYSLLIGIVFLVFTTSCISTKINMKPSYGFKFKKNERVTARVIQDDQTDSYWTSLLTNYLHVNGIEVQDYNETREVMYSHLISEEAPDSLGLIKLGNLLNLDYLVIGKFDGKSENTGIGYNVLSKHEQLYHDDDYDRWRDFHLTIFDLNLGEKALILKARANSSGIEYEGDSPGFGFVTRFFVRSNFAIGKKAFNKSIKTLCQ